MPYQINDRVALKDDGAAPAGSCGLITNDYGDGIHYDVRVTNNPPPGCASRLEVLAIYVEVVPCQCE